MVPVESLTCLMENAGWALISSLKPKHLVYVQISGLNHELKLKICPSLFSKGYARRTGIACLDEGINQVRKCYRNFLEQEKITSTGAVWWYKEGLTVEAMSNVSRFQHTEVGQEDKCRHVDVTAWGIMWK